MSLRSTISRKSPAEAWEYQYRPQNCRYVGVLAKRYTSNRRDRSTLQVLHNESEKDTFRSCKDKASWTLQLDYVLLKKQCYRTTQVFLWWESYYYRRDGLCLSLLPLRCLHCKNEIHGVHRLGFITSENDVIPPHFSSKKENVHLNLDIFWSANHLKSRWNTANGWTKPARKLSGDRRH